MTELAEGHENRDFDEEADSIPMTLVDFAELIWKRQSSQKITADILGWSRDKVAKYSALDVISEDAWALIVPTFENSEKYQQESDVTCHMQMSEVQKACVVIFLPDRGGAGVYPLSCG